MFKKILIAGAFLAALGLGGTGWTSSAEAGHPRFDRHWRGAHFHGADCDCGRCRGRHRYHRHYRGAPHPRSLYYYGGRHGLGYHGLSYKGPAYRLDHHRRRGPAFRLSIGF